MHSRWMCLNLSWQRNSKLGGEIAQSSSMSSGNKRYREASLLANEIRAADSDNVHEIDKRTKMQLDKMNDEQTTRFEFFVRSHLSRSKVESIIGNALGNHRRQLVTSEMAIVVGGLAKLFIGDLVETSLDVLKNGESEDDGLATEHIMEAFRRMQRDGKVGRPADGTFMFSGMAGAAVGGGDGNDLFDESINDLIETNE